ncbi:MAG: hypothetical protein HZA67_06125 [Rhodospirillales bacterium]|nr:hypothetical protein [Rhodospirillales bacterium]
MKLARLAIAFWLLFSGFEAAAETVTVSKRDCSRLIAHAPSADVAYKSGVDVKGRKVAPADLEGGGNSIKLLPEVLQFNININPVDYQARNALAAQKAATQKAIVANQQTKAVAQTQVTALTTQKATAVASGATLAADLAALQAVLTPLQTQVDAGTRRPTNQEYQTALAAVTAKQAEVTANTATQTSLTSQIATQQAIVNATPPQITALNAQKTTAVASGATLAAELAALQAVLTPLQTQVDAGTRRPTNQEYQTALAAVTAKQAEVTANTATQTSLTSQIATQQAIADTTPSLETNQTAIEAQQSALSAKGLDNTSMNVAAIKYDIAKNRFTINDQPLGSPALQELADACAKAGVK